MKRDLEILIDHLQEEYERLKSLMENCSAKWDYIGANDYKKQVLYIKGKLEGLKSMKYPNYYELKLIRAKIQRQEENKREEYLDPELTKYLGDKATQSIKEFYVQMNKQAVEKSRSRLESLESEFIEEKIDDDILLNLLEDLNEGIIKRLDFELLEDTLFLTLEKVNNSMSLRIWVNGNSEVNIYFSANGKRVLSDLGFNAVTYSKKILHYKTVDHYRLLGEIATIYLEGIRSRKRGMKVALY